ncbi:MAG: hypothetical protein Q7J35_01085 [Candidatus Methanoperedens sp.]|nr:hypothetical protein [Candidatus Methanoperedens sp.]
MWLLIKLNSLNDIGQNEAERILIHESDISLKKRVSSVEISAYGVSVHPNTLDIGKITPQMMREYLLKCGWVAKPFGREEVLKFESPQPFYEDKHWDVLIPSRDDLIDYRRGVEVALDTISKYEARSAYEVFIGVLNIECAEPCKMVGVAPTERGRASMAKFSDEWKVREDLPGSHLLEQNNCPVDSGEICRDFRILGARQISPGKWRLFRALDDGRGFHSERDLGVVEGTKEDAVNELQEYRD